MDATESEQIKAGLQKSFRSGKSVEASTVRYGYRITAEGDLMAYPAEAIYVFHVFERFAAGDSLGKISASLARMNVLLPIGKDIWSKETISKIFNNEKYTGCVILQKNFVENYLERRQIKNIGQMDTYQILNNHRAIISFREEV